MIEKSLEPILDKDEYSNPLIREIEYALYRLIYKPMLEACARSSRTASKASLVKALENGSLTWADGFFSGAVSASVSKALRDLGATFNRARRLFHLELKDMPQDLRAALSRGKLKTWIFTK